jgi:hypothetical protein
MAKEVKSSLRAIPAKLFARPGREEKYFNRLYSLHRGHQRPNQADRRKIFGALSDTTLF